MNWNTSLICLCVCLVGIVVAGGEQTHFERFQEIAHDTATSPAAKRSKIDAHLRSLSRPVFISFLYAMSQDSEYANDHVDIGVLMGFLAQSYLAGPGKDEPVLETLSLLADPKIFYGWKMALIGVLRLKSLGLLPAETTAGIAQALQKCASDKKNPELLRAVCLKRLNSYLQAQEEHILMKHPRLRAVLEAGKEQVLREQTGLSEKERALGGDFLRVVSGYNATVRATLAELTDSRAKRGIRER